MADARRVSASASGATKLYSRIESPFRFLDLPAELRNAIYEYVFSGHVLLPYYLLYVNARTRRILALTRVNKQVHAETALLPYTLSTFKFWELDDMRAFVDKCIEGQLGAVQKIALGVVEADFVNDPWNRVDRDLSLLTKFPNLNSVEIDFTDYTRADDYVKRCIESMRVYIHTRQPKVVFTARVHGAWVLDRDGKWHVWEV